jgi:hypothetical protein
MGAPADQVLGVSYIDPEYFIENAKVFGCQATGYTAETILPLLAAASRMIDGEVGRSFLSAQIAENHRFDLATRRIKVNQPPIQTLVSYKIRTGAGLVSSFLVAPVTTDGVNNVSFGAVYYNRQENYLELSSLAMVGSLTNAIVSLGLSEPQVEIVYTSYQSVPQQVIAATGFMAAALLNESAANEILVPGLESAEADDVKVRRARSHSGGGQGQVAMPANVKMLLRGLSRIAIG